MTNPNEQAGLAVAVEDLLTDVAGDGFTLYCCGPRAAPNALVACYEWDQYVDLLTIQKEIELMSLRQAFDVLVAIARQSNGDFVLAV